MPKKFKKTKKSKRHPHCRIGADVDRALRHNGSRWLKDAGRGTPGLMFVSASKDDPDDAVLWVAECKCDPSDRRCPVVRGLQYTSDLGFVVTSIVRVSPVRI